MHYHSDMQPPKELQLVSTVCILLSTFNGMRFLPEQISSLKSQIGVNVEIIAQDDGSTDGTLEYLRELRLQNKIAELRTSHRLGSTSVFVELIKNSPKADFYCFCDQDDIWSPDKILTLIDAVPKDSKSEPILVFCDRTKSNSNGLRKRVKTAAKAQIGLHNALVQSVIPGNCMLLNSSSLQELKSFDWSRIRHYDAFIYLILSVLGKIIYVNKSLVWYRIHQHNQIGDRKGLLPKISDIQRALNEYSTNAREFNSQIQFELDPGAEATINYFLCAFDKEAKWEKFVSLSKSKVVRQSRFETFLLRILPLLKSSFFDAKVKV